MYLLSALLVMVLSCYYLARVTGADLVFFLDAPSLILLLLLTIPILMSAGLLRDFNNAFRLSIRRRAVCSHRELDRAAEAVSLMIRALWVSGIFNVLFTMSSIFFVRSSNLEYILTYIAVAALPLIYAAIFVILLLPMQSRLKLRRLDLDAQPQPAQTPPGPAQPVQSDSETT